MKFPVTCGLDGAYETADAPAAYKAGIVTTIPFLAAVARPYRKQSLRMICGERNPREADQLIALGRLLGRFIHQAELERRGNAFVRGVVNAVLGIACIQERLEKALRELAVLCVIMLHRECTAFDQDFLRPIFFVLHVVRKPS